MATPTKNTNQPPRPGPALRAANRRLYALRRQLQRARRNGERYPTLDNLQVRQ